MNRILVIDDEPEIVSILKTFLSKKGFEVLPEPGGSDGIEIINSGIPVNLMILDLKMPKVTGIDVLHAMKKSGREIPFIILSGSLYLEKHIREIQQMGYAGFDVLAKPADLDLLLETVNKKLGIEPGK